MAWSTTLVGVTNGYINLIFGERYENIIAKDRLRDFRKYIDVPFTCGIKSNMPLKFRKH